MKLLITLISITIMTFTKNTVNAENYNMRTANCEVQFTLRNFDFDAKDGIIQTGDGTDDGHTLNKGDKFVMRKKWKFLTRKKTLIRVGKKDIRFNHTSQIKSGENMCDLKTMECKINFCNMIPTYYTNTSITHSFKSKHSMSVWQFNIPGYYNDILILTFGSKKHFHHNGIIHAGELGN